MPFVLHRQGTEPVAVPEQAARRMIDESVGTGEIGQNTWNKLLHGSKAYVKGGYLLWVREGEEPSSKRGE